MDKRQKPDFLAKTISVKPIRLPTGLQNIDDETNILKNGGSKANLEVKKTEERFTVCNLLNSTIQNTFG